MMSSSEDHETTLNPSLLSPVKDKDKDLTTASSRFKTPSAKFPMWFKQFGIIRELSKGNPGNIAMSLSRLLERVYKF